MSTHHCPGYATRHLLAQQAKLRMFGNILRRQLCGTQIKGTDKVRRIDNLVLDKRKRMAGATGKIYYELCEFEEMNILKTVPMKISDGSGV